MSTWLGQCIREWGPTRAGWKCGSTTQLTKGLWALHPFFCENNLALIWTRITRTPAFWGYPLPPHDYPYYWVILDPKWKEDRVKITNLKNLPKFQIFKFWNKHYTRHTFWSCLIRCANMKWIRWILLKIQSGHDSVHRRTDGQTDKVKPVYPLSTSLKRGYTNVYFH